MALSRYLGGVGLALLGLFLIFIGIIGGVASGNTSLCLIFCFIGFLLFLIGGFYSRTAHRLVPQKIDIISNKKSDRYCPECGRGIPFDANICPYCGKKF